MASIIYNSFLFDVLTGNIVLASDTFKIMLVTSAYVPDKDAHTKRSDVTNEVVGSGYSAGGQVITLTRTDSNPLDRTSYELSQEVWDPSTITARGAVIYKSRGGTPTADELVCYLDFGGEIISINGSFTVTPTDPLIFQN
jgi:hypothetical protein